MTVNNCTQGLGAELGTGAAPNEFHFYCDLLQWWNPMYFLPGYRIGEETVHVITIRFSNILKRWPYLFMNRFSKTATMWHWLIPR